MLCHDLTKIVPGVEKGARFRKGHVVTEEDIPELLAMGKEHLYIWEKKEGILHEDEAAQILYEICCGDHMHKGETREGKIELFADCDGLFKIRREGLEAVNARQEMMIATRHSDFPVKKGDKLGAARIIPLVIEEEKMNRAREAAGAEPLFSILPFRHKRRAS